MTGIPFERPAHPAYITSQNEMDPDSDEPPEAFLCPINSTLMMDPVLTAAGNTYDRPGITEWLETHDTDPLTNQVLPTKELKENRALRDAIEEFLKTSQLFLDRRNVDLQQPAIGAGSSKSVFKGSLRIRGKTVTVAALK